MIKKIHKVIPTAIGQIAQKIEKSNYQIYLVGGSLRDLFLGKKLKDFDLTTDAKPEEILAIFPNSFYNNTFGTVGVKFSREKKQEEVAEITTFRREGFYSDQRHPDSVSFTKNIQEDLERRDFTINALVLDLKQINLSKDKKEGINRLEKILTKVKLSKQKISFKQTLLAQMENYGPGIEGEKKNLLEVAEVPQLGSGSYPQYEIVTPDFSAISEKERAGFLIDLYGGLTDLEKRLIRAVGDPDTRFKEDALRLLRAVRLATELGFKIEKRTAESIRKNAPLLQKIARERIQDELTKIMLSPWPAEGIILLHQLGLLKEFLPVLEEGYGVEQNWHHIYSVFDHLTLALKFCFSDELPIRLAALFHDVAKPRVKRIFKNGQATFHFHEVEGEKIVRKNLNYLHFPVEIINETALLVRYHMFNYDPALHNERTVRRMLHRVGGLERMNRLLILRIADRLGSGCKKGEVYKIRKLKYLIEKVSSDPISLKQLKINGQDLMDQLRIKPGVIIGDLLNLLLAKVIDNPLSNKREKLLKLAEEIWIGEKANPGSLIKRKVKAEKYLEEEKEKRDTNLQDKYWVRGGR